MSRNYSIVWLVSRQRMDPEDLSFDDSCEFYLPTKWRIPRDARMDGL